MPSKLEQLQLQFRQRLMQEKEEKMIKIHTDNQQKALSKVMKYESVPPPTVLRKTTNINSNTTHQSPVKKGSPGVDRSRPLPPISKEQKFYSSEAPHKVPYQNGTRSRSVDADMSGHQKLNTRTKFRTDPGYVTDVSKSSSNSFERHSPTESDYIRRKETELIRAKALAKVQASLHSESSKSNGFHSSTIAQKSSNNDSRTMPGSVKPQVSNNLSVRGKYKPTVSTNSNKTSVAPKHRNGVTNGQVRKPPNPNQQQCRNCGRNFNKDRIEKHESICIKTSKKKVKVFDATKMRVQGTEAENFVKKRLPVEQPKPKKANWKKQHEDFINTIRQAKMAQRHLAAGGKLSDLPPPPPSDTSDYVPCPYCGRKFSEAVAERHIPKCKNILSNKKNPVKKK